MLRSRRSEVGRVGAPVELGHVDKLVRLRLSAEVAFAGHHIVGVLDAVVDVIHNVSKLWVFDGLQSADPEKVRSPVGLYCVFSSSLSRMEISTALLLSMRRIILFCPFGFGACLVLPVVVNYTTQSNKT